MFKLSFIFLAVAAASPVVIAVSSQAYTWKNVKIGGGGGFVPNIIFNPTEKGVAYARTDIGGAYKLNADDTWTPLLDFADHARWNYWGVDAIATDPIDTKRLYLATGMYTNSWDPNNGNILISADYGKTFKASPLPFKVGGNMPGRGTGERLAVDPNNNNVLFFGARSGKGLWKSVNQGATWTQVTTFPSVGTYIPDKTDTSGYNADIVGITFVTFDSTSATKGTTTPRIYVGVANKGTDNIFVTTNGGTSWSAVAGQNNTYIPHKGVLSPKEKVLYISTSDGAGPYDGGAGAVWKYNITSSAWTNITPVSGSDLYFGFGGVAVDLQRPGTLMVAALNSWYPDGQIFRSTNSGATWSPFWTYASYPTINKYYTYDDSLAPWLGPNYDITDPSLKQIGWMMEGLSIDPFDSNHWLYGTGATIYGGHDLLKWDTVHNVTLKSLADGIEETAITGLISPPTGPSLLSSVGDLGGFAHVSLTAPPKTGFVNPTWATSLDIDYAGNKPTNIVRIGSGDSTSGKQVALSTDSGATWSQDYGAADNVNGGKVALSANGDIVLWRTGSQGVQVSQNTAAFTAVTSLPSDAQIASDKKSNLIFYGASGSSFYLSVDGGKTFAAKGSLGTSQYPAKVIVNPGVTGDVWVSTDKGLFHSTNNGTSFAPVLNIAQAWGIALGAPAKVGGYPAIFAAANYTGTVGYFRSDDKGINWVQINDAAHGFGSASGNPISGDPRIYGRVYIGTNGRGIFYGDASGVAPTSTATPSPTPTSTSTTTITTNPPTSTTTTTTAPVATATPYGQCGGRGYVGPTVCATGWTCVVNNEYFSQCVQA